MTAESYDDEIRSGNRWVLILFALMVVFLGSMVYVSAIETKGGVYNWDMEYGLGTQLRGTGTSNGLTYIGDKNYMWQCFANASVTGYCSYSTTQKHSGNQSIKIDVNVSNATGTRFIAVGYNWDVSTAGWDNENKINPIPAKPNTTYKYSAWVYNEDANQAFITIQQGNSVGTYVTGTTSSSVLATATWTYLEINITTSATTQELSPLLYCASNASLMTNGTCYFDNIRLEEVDSVSLSTQQQGRPSITITGVTDTNAIDQSQTTQNAVGYIGNNSGTQREYYQVFKQTTSKLPAISLYKASTVGTPAGNIVIELKDVNTTGYPTSTVFASKTYTLSEWNALPDGFNQISLPAIVTPDKNYAIWVRDTNTSETSGNYYRIGTNSEGGYSNGYLGVYIPSTTSYTNYTQDFTFYTHFAKLSSSVDLNVVAPDGTSELKSYDVNGDILTDANITINPNGTGRYYYAPVYRTSTAGYKISYFSDVFDWNIPNTALSGFNGFPTNGLATSSIGNTLLSATWKLTAPTNCTFDGNLIYTPNVAVASGRYAYFEHSTNNTTWIQDANWTSNSTTPISINVDGNTIIYFRFRNGYSTNYIQNQIFDANLSCPSLTTPLFKNGTNTLYTMNKDADNQNGATLTPSLMSNLNFSFTAPTTTFTSFQVPNTTDQNITLTCTDNNSGCKTIWYNINNNNWIKEEIFINLNYFNSGTYGNDNIDYSDTLLLTIPIDNNLPRKTYLYSITNKMKTIRSNNSVYYNYYVLHYTDGTTQTTNTNSVSNTDGIYITKDYTFILNEKELDYIELYGSRGSSYGGYTTDQNIIYYQYNDSNKINFLNSGAGLDHNIQYFSTDNSDNNETTKTSTFTTYGNGRFYFKDENSGSDLTGVQVNFNGVDYNSGANNYLDFNFQTLSSTNTTYLFTITKTGYSTRYYQTDLNYFGDFNNTFALIPETLATNIQFKMFPPTGTTTLANTYIEFKDKDTNYTITRLKSNENGELTANLRSDDQNYLVWISEGTYIYQAVQLTILYPKDEQTLSDITGNWRIEITDNISYQDLNIPQGTNKIIYLLPNTKYPFTIAVQDVAGTYFKRKWSKIYQGNPLTDTLQPYLVNADDGIAVKFVFQDPKRDSIENIIINIYKNVGGIKTLISSGASDVTGNALFFLIAGDKYTLDFSYDGTIIFETQNYTVTSSTVYWTINLATREIKTVDGTFITIGFNPIQDYILKNATNISYKVTASGLNRTRAEFYIIQDGNKIITYTRDAPCTTPCTVTIPIEDLNITLGNKVYLDLNVYIDSNNYIFNYKKTWSYGTTSNIDTHDLFVKARIDFGCTTDTMWPCPLTSIVSIIIMILLIGSMVFTFNFVNPKGLLVAGLGILAVFTYLGWFWWVALVLIIIASIFYLRGD